MCKVFVPKRTVICYVDSQSHMTSTPVPVAVVNNNGDAIMLAFVRCLLSVLGEE